MRWRRLARSGPILAMIVVAAACQRGSSTPRPVQYRATSFRTGSPVSLADLKGRPVLLTSWATWCSECRKELPALERYREAHRRQDLTVVAVNVDGGGGGRLATDMVASFGLTMDLWTDSEDTFASTFAALGVPTTVLVDRRGGIVHVWQGGIDLNDPTDLGLIRRTVGDG